MVLSKGELRLQRATWPHKFASSLLMTITPELMAHKLVTQIFRRKAIIIVPECFWAGDEADLLVVTNNMRLIDIELKISRADLKRDRQKQKWWKTSSWISTVDGKGVRNRAALTHPNRVWKHYFAMPKAIWTDDLVNCLPSPASGIILFDESGSPNIYRMSKPDTTSPKIKPESCLELARLEHLRYWKLKLKEMNT